MTTPASPPVAGVDVERRIPLTSASEVFAVMDGTDPIDRILKASGVNDSTRIAVAYALIADRKDRALASPGSSADADTHRAAEGAILVLREPTTELYAEFANIDGPWCRGQMDCDDVWRALLDAQAEATARDLAQPAASRSPGMETLQASECTKHGEGDQ